MSTRLDDAWVLMEQARAAGNEQAFDLARRAWDELDRARDFRKIRNQHPVAKRAAAKGARLLRKAEEALP